MPLLRIDIIEGRSKETLSKMLDVLHECVVEAFEVPQRDRFQIVSQHKPEEMIIQDVGLGFERTKNVVVIQMTTTPRTLTSRKLFYSLTAKRLHKECGIAPSDLMINIISSSESNWSFGNGEAQFLNGSI
ncbi:MAG: tautomerase family protein [Rhizobiales bacterium]|nr:tautomerase family protein [Hyphomicrobiales bacterium]